MQVLTRRTVLRLCSLSLLAVLSGCQGDFPSSRVLDLKNVTVNESGSDWEIETTVRSRDNTDRGFRNVTIVGLTEGEDVVCRKAVGDMSIEEYQSEVTVMMSCSEFPTSIVPLTDESPCEENTYIDKRVYDDESDTWEEQEVECGTSNGG